MRHAHDPRGAVDRAAEVVVVAPLDRAQVQSAAHRIAMPLVAAGSASDAAALRVALDRIQRIRESRVDARRRSS